MQEGKSWKIKAVGCTDSIFLNEHYLQHLSEKRAWAVKNFLLLHGITSNHVHCFDMGRESPLYDNKKLEEAVKTFGLKWCWKGDAVFTG